MEINIADYFLPCESTCSLKLTCRLYIDGVECCPSAVRLRGLSLNCTLHAESARRASSLDTRAPAYLRQWPNPSQTRERRAKRAATVHRFEGGSHLIIIGIDSHPSTHAASAVDENGRALGFVRVENAPEGWGKLRRWALGVCEGERVVRWAMEGASNPFASSLVAELISDGEEVFSIHPSLTSLYRSKGTKKKNDEVDALNCARALLANPRMSAHVPCQKQRLLQQLSRNRKRLREDLKSNDMALEALVEEGDEDNTLKEILVG